jgi:hypothetical protein
MMPSPKHPHDFPDCTEGSAYVREHVSSQSEPGRLILGTFSTMEIDMRHFQITVKEIPNQYIVRKSYRETYEVTAECRVDAKQIALERFGDFSQIAECVEFDPDYPPGSDCLNDEQ